VKYAEEHPFQYAYFVNSRVKNQNDSKVLVGADDSLVQQQQLLQIWQDLETKMPPKNKKQTECSIIQTVDDMLELLKEFAGKNPNLEIHVLVTGSLYLVGGFFWRF